MMRAMPTDPRLPEVLLALAPVAAVPAETGWLTPSERDRLGRFGSGPRRAQFLAGHVLARQLAAAFAGGEPAAWHFHVADDQRRELRHADGRRLCLSLSHSAGQVAAAVSERPLGLDLEVEPGERDWAALAARLFAPATAGRITQAAPEAIAARFREAWALHEARAKQGGAGFQRAQVRRLELVPAEAGDAQALAWTLPGGCLALAGWPGLRAGFAAGEPGPAQAWRYADA